MSNLHRRFFTLYLMEREGRLLNPAQRADLQAHLANCPDCQMDQQLFEHLHAQAERKPVQPKPISVGKVLQARHTQARLQWVALPLRGAFWLGLALLLFFLVEWAFNFLRPVPAVMPPGNPTPILPTGVSPTGAVTAVPWNPQDYTGPGTKVLPGDLHSYDNFGSSLAVQGDLLVVGAPGVDFEGRRNAGAAYLFQKAGKEWQQIARLVADDPQPDGRFGTSVAIVGEVIVVGAPYEYNQGAGNASGAVYVFMPGSAGWLQTQRLAAPDGRPFDLFGSALAIREGTLAIGAQAADGPQGERDAGAVYVYRQEGNSWNLQARLGAGSAAFDHFGLSLAFTRDELLVGAPDVDLGQEPNAGQVYVYAASPWGWDERERLTANEGHAQARFGATLATQGEVLAVVAPQEYQKPYPMPPNAFSYESTFGVAHVFTLQGNHWQWQARLIPTPKDEQSAILVKNVTLTTVEGRVRLALGGYGMGGLFPFELQNGIWQPLPEIYLPQVSLSEGQALATLGDQIFNGNRFHQDVDRPDGSPSISSGVVWIVKW